MHIIGLFVKMERHALGTIRVIGETHAQTLKCLGPPLNQLRHGDWPTPLTYTHSGAYSFPTSFSVNPRYKAGNTTKVSAVEVKRQSPYTPLNRFP